MAALFTGTIFVSAFLLFFIQPMMAKAILPQLGGSPAVWNTAMVFFQAMLLLGYLYAHIGHRAFGTRRHSWLHGLLLVASLLLLPFTLPDHNPFDPIYEPIGWQLYGLMLAIGLPFFLISANAPLLQYWFAHTPHQNATNPYFMYSASNAGSLLALLGYPLLIEPYLGLGTQATIWSAGYIGFILLLIGCAVVMHKTYQPVGSSDGIEAKIMPPALHEKLLWVVIAFVPASLLHGVTTYITTDVAAAPLLWVVPLSLYLLSFILMFNDRMAGYHTSVKWQVYLLSFAVLSYLFYRQESLSLLVHLAAFFATAMVCHGRLYRNRPHPKFLTSFYLYVSLGGVLGGIFNALLAPQLFTYVLEYPLVLLLAALVRPRGDDAAPTRYRRPAFYALSMLAYAAAMFGLMSLWVVLSEQTADWPHKATLGVLLFVGLLGALLCSAHRVRYAAALAILCVSFMVAQSWFGTQKSTLYAERNFFGLSRVQVDSTYNARVYKHGTTLHGIQSLQDEQRLGIASYYHPIGDIIMHLPGDAATAPVAVGGMGVGTIACWGKPNQRMDFYEIDPVAERIALDENMFTYLSDCPPTVNVIIGDARLKLEQAEDAQYGLIVMDAYSSDSLPIHLITQEAVAMYASKLRDDGALAFNITNRHLHLAPIVASIADSLELSAWHKRDIVPEGDKSSLRFSSHWIVLAKDPATLAPLEEAPMSWQPLHGDGRTPWSDHYSNILEAL